MDEGLMNGGEGDKIEERKEGAILSVFLCSHGPWHLLAVHASCSYCKPSLLKATSHP